MDVGDPWPMPPQPRPADPNRRETDPSSTASRNEPLERTIGVGHDLRNQIFAHSAAQTPKGEAGHALNGWQHFHRRQQKALDALFDLIARLIAKRHLNQTSSVISQKAQPADGGDAPSNFSRERFPQSSRACRKSISRM